MSQFVSFVGGDLGPWEVTRIEPIRGLTLPEFARLQMLSEWIAQPDSQTQMLLRGVISHLRYTTADELKQLKQTQEGLGRPEAKCAVLIPMKKSEQWWQMPQDVRRELFEAQSKHTTIGMDYLPAIARQLHHSRDLGEEFDFLTWFEFAPEYQSQFDELLARLRATKEWEYVEREVEVRVVWS